MQLDPVDAQADQALCFDISFSTLPPVRERLATRSSIDLNKCSIQRGKSFICF